MINAIPDYRVTLDGVDITPQDITAKLRPRLLQLSITDKRQGEADQLDITLDDSDGLLDLPKEGALLHVAIGWKQGSEVLVGLVDKGSFKVDGVEHSGPPDAVTIRASAVDFTSDLRVRREQAWHDTTIGAVIGDIAGRNGLVARCAPAFAGLAVKMVAQSRESDMALLRRLGREHDAVATIKAGALIFAKIGTGTTAAGQAFPSVTLRRRDGDRHAYRREKREAAEGVTATYHDRKEGRRKTVTAGKGGATPKLGRVYANEAEAKRAAGAVKSRADRQPVSLDLSLALGRADLCPEQRVTVQGFKPVIDATSWLIGEVTHTIGSQGYVTGLKLEIC